MTGEALPGRPGTLTPEQEEILRRFWSIALQVFGTLDDQQDRNGNKQDDSPSLNRKTTDSGRAEKPKKKKHLFSRKNKDSDTDSVASSVGPVVAADPEDKYGQTKQFHDTLASLSPEVIRETFWSMVKHDHPDALLLRFLRARKWDVERALVMMVSTMHWRAKEMHVDDDIMHAGEEGSLLALESTDPATKRSGEDFLAQMRMGKSYLHGTDKAGRPMCFIRARLHKQGEQEEPSLERYTVYVIETARMILSPPVDTACVVFDMTGFSLANMDYTPVKFMIKCFEANYPESLGVVLVHKAPWIFQGIWKIIRGLLDPVVASKVNFTNNVDEMEEFVARNQIPKELDGDEDWTYQYIEPMIGENSKLQETETKQKLLAERQNIVKAFEKATMDWIRDTSETRVEDFKQHRNQLASDLREDYWKLDPYIRAQSYYDRTGMIQPGGNISFYPAAAPTTTPAAAPPSAATVETSADDLD